MIDDRIEELAVVGDDQEGARKAPQPGLEPHDRVEIEVIGRLVEEQEVRRRGERARHGRTHPPAAGQRIQAPRLVARRETESAQDSARERFGGIPVDGLQLRVRRRCRHRIATALAARQPRTDRRDARVSAHDVVDEPRLAGRRILGDRRDRESVRQLDLPAVGLQLAQQQGEEARLARPVRAHDTDLLLPLHQQAGAGEHGNASAAKLDLVESDHNREYSNRIRSVAGSPAASRRTRRGGGPSRGRGFRRPPLRLEAEPPEPGADSP